MMTTDATIEFLIGHIAYCEAEYTRIAQELADLRASGAGERAIAERWADLTDVAMAVDEAEACVEALREALQK